MKFARAYSSWLREQTYEMRRNNDRRDLKRLPWWRQRTLGNAIAALLRQLERR